MLLKYVIEWVILKMLSNRCQCLNKFACNPHKYWIFYSHFITQTLFRVQSISCFSIVLLTKNVSFVAVLLSFYVVTKLVYPICTHTEQFLTVSTIFLCFSMQLSFAKPTIIILKSSKKNIFFYLDNHPAHFCLVFLSLFRQFLSLTNFFII